MMKMVLRKNKNRNELNIQFKRPSANIFLGLESVMAENRIIIGLFRGEKCNNLPPVRFFISLLAVAANFWS